MMNRTNFEEPLVVWLIPDRHDLGVRRIWDVQEGLAALHRYGIERLQRGGEPCREWREAAAALLLAHRHPTPHALNHARRALGSAAEKAGALAAPEKLSRLVAAGHAFAP
jgi:hypothetical protein